MASTQGGTKSSEQARHDRPRRFFIVTRSLANLAIDRTINFAIQGFDSVNAARYAMQPGDRLLVYAKAPISGFVASVEIVSEKYEDHGPIWSKHGEELFAYRYQSRARIVVRDADGVAAKELIPDLELARYLRDESRWGMLFRNAVRSLPEEDFDLVEGRLRAAATASEIASDAEAVG